MAKGISIGVASDTREFTQGVKKGVIEPLEDASDVLDDLGRDGTKAGEELERSLRGARDETSDFKKEQAELGEAMQRASKQGGDAFKRNIHESTESASENLREVKSEALQNASETFSSFDGSVTSLIDGVQGTFGGLVSSLTGPAGMLAAIAGAAGIGLISSAFQAAGEDEEAFKEKVSELAQEMFETGKIGKRSFDQMVSDVQDLATETDDSKTNLADLQKVAKALHRPLSDVVAAYEQGGDALADMIKSGQKQLEQLEGQKQTSKDAYGWDLKRSGEAANQKAALTESNQILGEQQKALKGAADQQKLAAKAGLSDLSLKRDLISQINDGYDDAAAAVDDYIDAETGIFDTDAYIKAMHEREEALANYQRNLANTGLTPEAQKFLESQGVEAASSMLQGYVDASPATKTELARIWTEAGQQASGSAARAIEAGLPKQIAGPVITLTSNADEVQRQIQKLADGHYRTTFTVDGVTRQGRRIF